MPERPSIFCITSYEKGQRFLEEAHRLGCDVTLLTLDKHRQGSWPHESLAGFHTMPAELTDEQKLNTLMYLSRSQRIDRLVSLDEFDMEFAALAREHMRLPGMGQTATRLFRDKLAMRVAAKDAGVSTPEFTRVINHAEVGLFLETTRGPWLLKPRTNAATIGIRKVEEPDQIWPLLDELGDLQSHYVLERFVPGAVFHVEGVTWRGEVLFAAPHQYGQPPMKTMHQGGVFTTRALDPESEDARALIEAHARVIAALGMASGVTHTEFIRSDEDGRFYFLESAARVGGAHIADVVEHAVGLNPWVEWARIVVAELRGESYRLPELRHGFAGSVISLARQERPDTSAYSDAEIVQRLDRSYHAGLIVRSESAGRVQELVDGYAVRFLDEFCATAPVPDKPSA